MPPRLVPYVLNGREVPFPHLAAGGTPTPYVTLANRLLDRSLLPCLKNRYGKGNMARVTNANSPVAHWKPRPSYNWIPKSGKAADGPRVSTNDDTAKEANRRRDSLLLAVLKRLCPCH